MRPELLQTGFHNLRQVTALVLFGDADGFLDLSFSQTASDGGSEFTRLLAGLAERDVPVNHDSDGPCRHDREQNHNGLGGESHGCPHGT